MTRQLGYLIAGMCALFVGITGPADAQVVPENVPVRIDLPTDNRALFDGGGPDFYMYTDRQIKPDVAPPWTGGTYGFVRNIQRTSQGVVYSRFHEGIDVKPLRRSANQEPMDEVRSISDGVVVYVNTRTSKSSYGIYVVIEHLWGGAPFYSLYAHLKSATVSVEDVVAMGDKIGMMGYTGRGINRRRAHLHLEINLLLSQSYPEWHEKHFPDDPNEHGIFNGFNLRGLDVASLYLALQDEPELTMREFIERQEPGFEVTVPGGHMLDMLWRYPWLSPDLDSWNYMFGEPLELGVAWKITFANSGLPLRFEALDEPVEEVQVRIFEQSSLPYSWLTNELVRGRGDGYWLGDAGKRLIDLITSNTLEFRDEDLTW